MRHSPGSWSRSVPRLAVALLCAVLAACGPRDPLEEIRKQQAAGDLAGSLEPLRELINERPDAEVYFLYGRALALTGQTSLAEWSLRKAMEDPEWLVRAGLQLGLGALRARNYDTVLDAVGQILELEPDNVNALLLRANAHVQSNLAREEALVDLERVEEIDPDNIEILPPRILALLSLDRVEEAGVAIEELGRRIEELGLGQDSAAWHCSLQCLFAEESDEIELARERWAECLEKYPIHGEVVGNAITFYESHGEPDRALEILRTALEKAPYAFDYRTALVARLRARGEVEEAEALLREATESESPHAAVVAWLTLAEHFQQLGDAAAGAEAADRAVELAGEVGFEHPHLLFEHAEALIMAGQLDRAQEVAEGITVPAHRELMLARIAQQRGRYPEALEHYDEAFRFWPDNAPARYLAAIAAEGAGDFGRAIEAYRYSIRIDPTATDARTRLARLHLAEGKPGVGLSVLITRLGQAPLELDGQLLLVRLRALVGQVEELKNSLAGFERATPENRARALVSAAEGVAAREGPARAAHMLLASKAIDLSDPEQAEALRAVVRFAQEGDVLGEAKPAVDAALSSHPDAATAHESLGLWLEAGGASADEVTTAYTRALEIDPENARALAGLGRLALAEDPAEALTLFDRALEADPLADEARWGAVRALLASGQEKAAEERLAELLLRDPFDTRAAAQLAELRLDGGLGTTDETLSLARRAVRFGRSPDALDLLARVLEARDEPEQAAAAAARARALRGEPDA